MKSKRSAWPVVLGILLAVALVPWGLLPALRSPVRAESGETGIRGEDADRRVRCIAFGRENAERLSAMAAAAEGLSPVPFYIHYHSDMEPGQRLTCEWKLLYGERALEDAALEELFIDTPIEGMSHLNGGWRFDLAFSSGFLDTGRYYALEYRAGDPRAANPDTWEPSGDGWTRTNGSPSSICVEYVEPLDDDLWYTYEGWF